MERPRIVLASASPRRRELLAATGLVFEVRPSAADEELAPGTAAEAGALELALRKAEAVAAGLGGGSGFVLGADTVVALGEGRGSRCFGKPADGREAREMLASLSGTRHLVVTGVCALRLSDGARRLAAERTWVTMREIEAEEIEAYVASGEWRDKAGGYAIQESADRFVTRLEGGGFDNVVGLPVALALRLLTELGADLGSAGAGRTPLASPGRLAGGGEQG